jgi:hypothetical protein
LTKAEKVPGNSVSSTTSQATSNSFLRSIWKVLVSSWASHSRNSYVKVAPVVLRFIGTTGVLPAVGEAYMTVRMASKQMLEESASCAFCFQEEAS